MHTSAGFDDRRFDEFVPALRPDAIVRRFDNEAVAWSPAAITPVYLDPLAALVLQLLDGSAPIAELLVDIHEVVGVPLPVARTQLRRVVGALQQGALLTTSPSELPIGLDFDLFSGPPNT